MKTRKRKDLCWRMASHRRMKKHHARELWKSWSLSDTASTCSTNTLTGFTQASQNPPSSTRVSTYTRSMCSTRWTFKKLLRPFFFTADTQVLLGQMERRGSPDDPPNCSGSRTHHQIQGTGKTALVVATQTHFTITQRKPPRGQWWTSKVRQDLWCHPSSAYMRMQVRKGAPSIMINRVVGDSRKPDIYTTSAWRNTQRAGMLRCWRQARSLTSCSWSLAGQWETWKQCPLLQKCRKRCQLQVIWLLRNSSIMTKIAPESGPVKCWNSGWPERKMTASHFLGLRWPMLCSRSYAKALSGYFQGWRRQSRRQTIICLHARKSSMRPWSSPKET